MGEWMIGPRVIPKPLSLLIVAAFVGIGLLYESQGPNKDNSKFNEMQQLSAAIPMYPGMTEINSQRNSTASKAILSKNYALSAPYDEVRRFYVLSLIDQGWRFKGERTTARLWSDQGGSALEFRKNDYDLSIEYAGQKSGFDWDYSIGIYWSAH